MFGPLAAKVRISIPVSGDAATVLAAIGGLIMIAIVVFFAWAKVKEEGTKGWFWLGGWVAFIFAALAVAIFLGQLGAPDEPYFIVAGGVGLLGCGSALAMRAADSHKTGMWFAVLACLAMIAKLFLRAPLNIVPRGDDWDVMPAGWGDPKMLVIMALAVVFGALAFRLHSSATHRSSSD